MGQAKTGHYCTTNIASLLYVGQGDRAPENKQRPSISFFEWKWSSRSFINGKEQIRAVYKLHISFGTFVNITEEFGSRFANQRIHFTISLLSGSREIHLFNPSS